jgi:hypothetical protein
MNGSQAFLKLAFLGMKSDTEEIIDYIVIWFSILMSLMVCLGTAIWTVKIGGMWMGLVIGFGVYAASIRLWSFAFLRSHQEW